ncbi:MAG: tryptophan 7-halogenase [Actinobacteria bacterium]|nr:tryptophan 7-halogenase [Actinomycetota bacterium]MDQ3533191.1 tryptophan 7-halogenase [Actinomycetota bacterium]
MRPGELDADVIIIGGGPAGSTLATLLSQAGHKSVVIERDIHPRDHVGEALTPSTNFVFDLIGFLPKMEEAGFFHKSGVGWTAPNSPIWKFLAIRTSDYPPPNAIQPYSYNVERDLLDALLLRHAFESGAKVLQGVAVKKVLFEGDRAVGVRAAATDGWERDLFARTIVDASGRRCLLATQLGLKRKDPQFNQYAIYSWFKTLGASPPGFEDFLFLHFLGLERAWGWQIPMRNGIVSVGVVTDKGDFRKSGKSHEQFFESLIGRNRTMSQTMQSAERIKPWWIEGDYSYKMEQFSGRGWLLVGDALRFVDPIFSSGVDVALYSALFAHEAIEQSWRGNEQGAFQAYEKRVSEGVDIWYELTELFYRLQLLFTWFAISRRHRQDLVRVLQGNPYLPETQTTARQLIVLMREFHDRTISNPESLLRPAGLRRG